MRLSLCCRGCLVLIAPSLALADGESYTNAPLPPLRAPDSVEQPAVPRGSLKPVYFPPITPALGDLSVAASVPTGGPFAAPEEMALYLDEPFYAMLATRLATRDFSLPIRHRLDHYRIARDNLLVELRAELERTHDFPRADRLAALQELAAKQTPLIAALEREGETLRDEISRWSNDWSAHRMWSLTEGGYSDYEKAEVMRATAYYQDGLSPAQRRLLREIAQEIFAQPRDAANVPLPDSALYFLPETSRVKLDPEPSGALAEKVFAFKQLKTALKQELIDLVITKDNVPLNIFRTPAYERLAQNQAPRFTKLEKLAEEIRVGHQAARPPIKHTVTSPLPPILTGRIAAVLDQRRALQRDTMPLIDAVVAQYPNLPAVFTMEYQGLDLRLRVIPDQESRDPRSVGGRQIDRFREQLAVIIDAYEAKRDQLTAEVKSLQTDVATFLGTDDPRQLAAALGAVTRFALYKATEDAYEEYRVATLEPGLSSEQRRLLFGGALVHLDNALPNGKKQPFARGG